jgi:hypothetical protein
LADFVADESNFFEYQTKLLRRFSPDSLSVMEFQSQRDYAIAEKIYGDWPLIGEEVAGSWNIKFSREFDMTNDRRLFNQIERGLPLYEGKMIHQFDAYYAKPRYWIEEVEGSQNILKSATADWYKGYRVAFREIARSTDIRTCIAAVLPPKTFAGHTLWVGVTPNNKILLYYISVVNSFCLDWITRFKVGTHVTLFVMKQLPIPRLNAGNPYFDAIVPRAAQLACTTPAFADLWQSVMGSGWDESHAITDSTQRQALRDDLDALVAHLYGLTRSEFAHILGNFPLVFPEDAEGEARQSRLLAVYDYWQGRV